MHKWKVTVSNLLLCIHIQYCVCDKTLAWHLMWLWLQTNGVRALASELTSRRELRALRVGETLKGALHSSGVSLHPYPDRGEGSFSDLVNFPEVPGTRGFWCWWWHWSCKSSLHVCTFFTLIHNGNWNDNLASIVHATEIARSWDCTLVPHNLKNCVKLVHNLAKSAEQIH